MTTESKPVKAASRTDPEPFILPGTTIGGAAGIFRVDFTISNPSAGQFRQLNGLVDTGASYTIIPAAILEGMGVEPLSLIPVRYAYGSVQELRLGEVRMELEGMFRTVQVLFGASRDTYLLGAMSLEAFALAADATNRRLIPVQVTA